MRQELTIDLNFGVLEEFQKSSEKNGLTDILRKFEPLIDLLNNYYYETKGKIRSVKVLDDSVNFVDKISGFFKLEFSVNYTNGCQDLNYDDRQSMVINFKINFEDATLKLEGEEIREREPDEL